ncbi:hypothetical protein [Sediminispirochaeta bajacaliforniensis]|uniref:hypothetical protein n=1 Tax=Sediminispirochaeta bajacaliforniensis TaxID=148 RepID=UPI000364B731|nr:hypothetical protein [Sediminispirochaeta bajacaliforniensis]
MPKTKMPTITKPAKKKAANPVSGSKGKPLSYVQRVADNLKDDGFYEKDNWLCLNFEGTDLRFGWRYGVINDYQENNELQVFSSGGGKQYAADGTIAYYRPPKISSRNIVHQTFILKDSSGKCIPYHYTNMSVIMRNGHEMKDVFGEGAGGRCFLALINSTTGENYHTELDKPVFKTLGLLPPKKSFLKMLIKGGILGLILSFPDFLAPPYYDKIDSFLSTYLPFLHAPYTHLHTIFEDGWYFFHKVQASAAAGHQAQAVFYSVMDHIHLFIINLYPDLTPRMIFVPLLIIMLLRRLVQNIKRAAKMKKKASRLAPTLLRMYRALV